MVNLRWTCSWRQRSYRLASLRRGGDPSRVEEQERFIGAGRDGVECDSQASSETRLATREHMERCTGIQGVERGYEGW